jgi:tRNA (guanine26-N2/guanine27-N2)-dimethyltransferase
MKYVEGNVEIKVPDRIILSKKNETFLNEHKKFDRDIHILLLKALGLKNKSYLDLFSASGIRALRIGKETDCFSRIICNDLNKKAVKNVKKNAKMNNVKIEVLNLDARELLCNQDLGGLDYIDIDPYGSPIYFIVDAVKKLSRGGILSITATDTGALSGTFPTTCKRRYHSNSYLSEFYYESGIRILCKECINLASTFDVALVPIFAHATRHYFRIYFKKVKGAKEADKLVKQIDYISYCKKCLHREIGIKTKCDCDEKTIIIGPLYTGNLWDEKLVKKMKKSGEYPDFFEKILEEIKASVPWFYTTDKIAKKYKIPEPRMRDLNYARTHISPKGFKTKKNIKEIINLIS